jgi:hypothetical protein
VTKFGLARYHLIFGYQHDAWDFYRAGKDESVDKAKEIETIIDEYERIVIDELEKNIGTRKLEKNRKNEVFFGSYFPLNSNLIASIYILKYYQKYSRK